MKTFKIAKKILFLTIAGLIVSVIQGPYAFAANPPGFKNRASPMPPDTNAKGKKEIIAAFQIPEHIEDFKFQVTGTAEGVEFFKDRVPTFFIEEERKRVPAEGLPVGAEIVPEAITALAGRHFYGVKSTISVLGLPPKTMWIDGRFLTITPRN